MPGIRCTLEGCILVPGSVYAYQALGMVLACEGCTIVHGSGFTPEYLKIPVPPPRTHLFGTRSGNDLQRIKCRTNSYSNSFYPHTVQIWNEIGPALWQAPSLSILKSNILKLIRPPKKHVFNIHDPKNLKILFQRSQIQKYSERHIMSLRNVH